MHRPDRRDEERRPELADKARRERIDQNRVEEVDQEIDRVISERMVLVSQNRVVEKVGERGERPVDAAFARGPPVGVLQDQFEIGRSGVAKPRVVEQQRPVIEDEAAIERIPEREQRQGGERRCGKQV